MDMHVGGIHSAAIPGTLLNVQVFDNDPRLVDRYAVIAIADSYPAEFLYPPLPDPRDPGPPTLEIALSDPSGAAITSLDLPTTVPDLSAFPNRQGFLIISDNTTGELLTRVEFQITSLAAVPEPATLGLLATTGLLLARRRLV